MKVNLRFGMHKDIQLLHQEKQLIDGLVIPAHILAHQSASTSVFVASMPDKPYIIDPMTFVLQENCLKDDGQLRPSVEKMFNAYHTDLAKTMRQNGEITPKTFPNVREFCELVFKFQRDTVADGAGTSAANKYFARYQRVKPTQPRLFVAPYFCFSTVGDRWYKLSHKCAVEFASLNDSTAAIICCPVAALSEDAIAAIAGDYSQFDTVIVWLDDYAEAGASVTQIGLVRQLLKKLRSSGPVVETLYGGFLMLLSHFDGLDALSHGILYTQHKSTGLTPGGGGAPERYYIPKIHDFRSLSQTDLILHRHPELICDCEICEEHIGNDPDNIILFRDNPELLRSHFLAVRRREADEIESSTPVNQVRELRRVFRKYDDAFRSLPNPDAFVQDTPMQGLAYLSRWADAFAE